MMILDKLQNPVIISVYLIGGIEFSFFVDHLMSIDTDKKLLLTFITTIFVLIEIFFFSMAIYSLKQYLCEE